MELQKLLVYLLTTKLNIVGVDYCRKVRLYNEM